MIETYRGTVYPWHCDHMGHMNIQYYAARFDEATWQLFSIIGLTPRYLKDNNRGMAAVEQKTEYKNELLPGDVITVYTTVIEMSGKTIRFRHVMKNSSNGQMAAATEFVGVHIDTVLRKSCTFESSIVKKTEELRDKLSESDASICA